MFKIITFEYCTLRFFAVPLQHSTLIVVKNSQYNVKVDKSLFTVAKLEKGL